MDKAQMIDNIIGMLNDAGRMLVSGQPLAWGQMTAGAVQQLAALKAQLQEEEKCEQ